MTVQVEERMLYKGEVNFISTEPLREYLEQNDLQFFSLSSSCWRGYTGTWEINDNKLYLVELVNCLFEKKNDLKYMFKQKEDKVFANWFSGNIVIPIGEVLEEGLFGIDDIYEQNIILKFSDGILISEEVVDNT